MMDAVPLFPLPACVLFPGIVLPLHIFEPRYRQMAEELLRTDPGQRFLALGLLKPGFEATYCTPTTPVHDVVCTGRVLKLERVSDRRFNLLVLGTHRAKIIGEDSPRPYRSARLNILATDDDLEEAARVELLDALRSLLGQSEFEDDGYLVMLEKLLCESAPWPALIDMLAYRVMAVKDSELKQCVLAETSLSGRANIVRRYLQAELRARRHARSMAGRHAERHSHLN